MQITLGELAEKIGAQLRGDSTRVVTRVATLQAASGDAVAFLSDDRYRSFLSQTRAGAVILRSQDASYCPVAVLLTPNPHAAYARAAALLHPPPPAVYGIHPSAWVDPSAHISATAWVGPHCVVEAQATLAPGVVLGPGCHVGARAHIGADSRLVAHVTLCHEVHIGARALILPGAVIGADGFGFAHEHGRWLRVPQLGRVILGDDVEVGANTTIDRGALEDTVIEDRVKLDNLIQIGHNVRIGADTAIAACAGVAGSTHIGRGCTIADGVGIAGHLQIADDVHITAMSLVTKSINEPGRYSSSVPAMASHVWNRNLGRLRQLDKQSGRSRALKGGVTDREPFVQADPPPAAKRLDHE